MAIIGLSATNVSAQKANPELVKIKVTKEGKIFRTDDMPIDYRNFVFTYDCENNQRLKPGMARKRKAEMCIDKTVLTNNPFAKAGTDEYIAAMKNFRLYMKAEANPKAGQYYAKKLGVDKSGGQSQVVADNSKIEALVQKNEALEEENAELQRQLTAKKPAPAKVSYELILQSAETKTLTVGKSRNFTALLKISTPEGLIIDQPTNKVWIMEVENNGVDLLSGGGLQITADSPGFTSFYGVYILPNGVEVKSKEYQAEVAP
ncbi:MAG TPA: hypothetical protein VHQ41_03065 [Patescibacteria group bacterium]|nr:hypothetical protein [Patescibacteria group bacterium]